MKKLLLILTFIAVGFGTLLAQTSTPPSNYGTSTGLSGDPYFISSLNNLYWLSQTSADWDKYYEQTTDIDASTTSDWDPNFSSNHGFSPIGNFSTKFSGSYDGQHFIISNLYVNRSSQMGLFGEIQNATITNVGVTNVDITGDSGTGGLVGYAYFSTISSCYSTGSVTGTHYIGNLIGHSHNSTVSDSYSNGSVTGSTPVGGLIGYNQDSNIYNCYSLGPVFGTNVVGGLVGQNDINSTIRNCYSHSDVSRLAGGIGASFGGFCGYNNETIEYCYSTGSVFYDGTIPTDKGFVGTDDTGTYKNNFWDSDASNQLTATEATAKTTAEMKDVATFTDLATSGLSTPVWDFVTDPNDDVGTDDYWDMDPTPAPAKVGILAKVSDIDDGYPFLGWQNGEDIALPVELSLFTVEVTNLGVLCKWTTESEIENLGFIFDRRTNGIGWTEIASYKTDNALLGQGTTSSSTDYDYIDKLVEPNTTYEYRLADVSYDGVVTYHSVRTVTVEKAPLSSIVEEFTVLPAYPNPFNPITTLTYGLDIDSRVHITIYDITGQLITTLLNTEQTQGWHSIQWNGRNDDNKQVPAGIYLSKITSNNRVKTDKLILLK